MLLFFCLLNGTEGVCQAPINDDCVNAQIIPVNNNGYGLGLLVSSESDLTNATVQFGEPFHSTQISGGNDKKSVWYKFSIATHRAVNLELKQTGVLIPLNAAGFTVFKSSTCMPSLADVPPAKLTPLNQFGSSYNPCLDKGDYYVQISGRINSNGPIYLELTLGNPNVLNDYDFKNSAYNFGTISGGWNEVVYDVGCQTTDDSLENCTSFGPNFHEFGQSTWFKFTTDSYVDLIRLELGELINSSGGHRVGWNIYQGDCAANPNVLTLVDGCNIGIQSNFNASDPRQYWIGENYACEFLPNTTYSIQVFYYNEYQNTVGLRLYEIGVSPTDAPSPPDLLSSPGNTNALGILPSSPSGITTSGSDYLACNATLSTNPCGTVNPTSGSISSGLTTGVYKLATWYSFTLTTTSNVSITSSSNQLKRLYTGDATSNCNLLNPTEFIASNYSIYCMNPGTYSIQILGKLDTTSRNFLNPSLSQLSAIAPISIKVQNLGTNNLYGLTEASLVLAQSRVYKYNSGGVLSNGVTYTSLRDTLRCGNTVLPQSSSLCSPTNSKAIYRQLVIGSNGILTLSGGSIYLQYKLFRGDAQALALAQSVYSSGQTINGLTEISGCFDLYSTFHRVCVTPGTYTLVSFGDQGDVGVSDQPSIVFNTATTLFSNPLSPNNLGSLSSFPVTGIVDTWSCIDNPLTIDGQTPCNGATKQIYREFYISNPQYLNITNSGYSFRLFTGQISNGTANASIPGYGILGCMTEFHADVDACPRILPAGWYSVVVYASGGSYLGTNFIDGSIGLTTNISIYLTSPPIVLPPSFNRPYKAYVANSGSPVVWGPNTGTTAIPISRKTYTFGTEHFNCNNDLPFISHPINPCSGTDNRVAYFVFTLTQESYVNISNIASSLKSRIYKLDVRTSDSLLLPTAPLIQNCISTTTYYYDNLLWSGDIEICKIQPGTYTLVIFANDSHINTSVTPVLLIDKVEESRFDHAKNAYDFGEIPLTNTELFGKPGDVNPLDIGRQASNDFFTCKTGAQPNDPANFCWDGLNPNVPNTSSVPYPMPTDYTHYSGNITSPPIRRNLWYSFTANGAGTITVSVYNKTPNSLTQYPFSIYKSDVNGTIPFSTLESTGQIDSTFIQGLTLVEPLGNSNYTYYGGCSSNSLSISFNRGDPCSGPSTERYYILVDHHSHLELNNQVEVGIKYTPFPPVPDPFYNRPHKAYIANGGAPIVWGPNVGNSAISQTSRTYVFGTEHFNCRNDLPFNTHSVTGCNAVDNRVAYYVFTLSQESYVNFSGIPSSMRSKVFALDVRTSDSLLMASASPIQECISTTTVNYDNQSWTGNIELCRMQPGTYTMVVFANDTHNNLTLTPVAYVEKVENSRFDHANKAYDFGAIPPNNVTIYGKVGDLNPLDPGRAPSNDFFTCTTGAQPNDPTNFCWDGGYQNGPTNATVQYPMSANSAAYSGPTTYPPIRRNLWYTFTVQGAGTVTIDVINKTPNRLNQYPFSIYRSDANGSIPFSTLVSGGQVDSTFAQGLTLVVPSGNSNYDWWNSYGCISNSQQRSFVNNDCASNSATRYYIIIDHHSQLELNSQVEVGIKFDGQPSQLLLYDHYSHANLINGLSEIGPIYTQTTLYNGEYSGSTGYFACATSDLPDPNSCGDKTLWYKVITGSTGKIKLNYTVAGPITGTFFNSNNIQLYRQVAFGDSSSNGLIPVPLSTINVSGLQWGEACMDIGIYYILLTGCNYSIETVVPNISLTSQSGDFCSDPIPLIINEADTVSASTTVDCHTMGYDFGEDDGNLSCLFGPEGFKTSWYKVSISGTLKMDVTFKLSELTTAFPNQIRYRVLFGTCGALTAGPCNTDALTEFTLNCMPSGTTDYFVQVVSPEWATGSIDLNVSTVITANQDCEPTDPQTPIANFTVDAACDGESIHFNNQSTTGSAISYYWDFGCCAGANSTMNSPSFTFPTTGYITTYNVTLIVSNDSLLLADTLVAAVTVYPRPTCSITIDSPSTPMVELNTPITFHANAINTQTSPPTLYSWNFDDGQTSSLENPIISYNSSGTYQVSLEVSNGSCSSNCELILTTAPAFIGDNNDGFGHGMFMPSTNCTPSISIYSGNTSDGFSTAQFINSSLCTSNNIYLGNIDDGFSGITYLNIGFCVPPGAYTGSTNDGFSIWNALNAGICALPPTAYSGDLNDGFSIGLFANSGFCSPPTPFTGDINDGFSYSAYLNPAICLPEFKAYNGNVDDGYSGTTYVNLGLCTPPSPYTGSFNDGFSYSLFSNLSICIPNNSAYSGNVNDGSNHYIQESLSYCEIPLAFLGNNNDGFGYFQYLNPDICNVYNSAYSGSIEDGFSPSNFLNSGICSSSIITTNGDINDGFSIGNYLNPGFCLPVNSYTGGGINDGFTLNQYINSSICELTSLSFVGNINDGFGLGLYLNPELCSSTSVSYQGNVKDGFQLGQFLNVVQCPLSPYLGSINDGFNRGIYLNIQACGNELYTGSVNDGFSVGNFVNPSICLPGNAPYSGNISDGASYYLFSIANTCIPIINAYSGNINDGYALSIFESTGACINNITAYQGNINDGNSTAQFITSSFCTPGTAYLGSYNDGFAYSYVESQTTCITTNLAYLGSLNDGFSNNIIISQTTCEYSAVSYQGNNNDGFSTNIFNSTGLCEIVSYLGNNNDGFGFGLFSNPGTCGVSGAFIGSIFDGFSYGNYLTNTNCSNIPIAYVGGINDGFTSNNYMNSSLCLLASYAGSINDGFASTAYINPSNCSIVNSAFTGNINDGFSLSDFISSSFCTPGTSYIGGINDGFSSQSWVSTSNCLNATVAYSGNVEDGFSYELLYNSGMCGISGAYNGLMGDGFSKFELNSPENCSQSFISYASTPISGNSMFKFTSSCDIALPINLIQFNAECNLNTAILNWATVSETNNQFFSIEKSTNGIQFELVGTLNGAGNSNTINHYSFIDIHPFTEISYYRLKQTDFNGSFTYSEIIPLKTCFESNSGSFIIYPNPSTGRFNIKSIGEHNKVYLIVHDMIGRQILRIDIGAIQSNEVFSIDLKNHSKGVYWLDIRENEMGENSHPIKLVLD